MPIIIFQLERQVFPTRFDGPTVDISILWMTTLFVTSSNYHCRVPYRSSLYCNLQNLLEVSESSPSPLMVPFLVGIYEIAS